MKILFLTAIIILNVINAFSIFPRDSIGITKIKDKSYIIHKVQKGDGFLSIARKYNTTDSALKASNPSLTELRINQKIRIPIQAKEYNNSKEPDNGLIRIEESHTNAESKLVINEKKHLVINGESLSKIALKYKVTQENIARWNNLVNFKIVAGQELIVSGTSSVAPYEKWNKLNSQSKKINSPINLISSSKNLIEESGNFKVTESISHRYLPLGTFVNCYNPINQKSILLQIQKIDGTISDDIIGIPTSVLKSLSLIEGNSIHIKYFTTIE